MNASHHGPSAARRVAVVGAGIVGVSCAVHLRREGFDVDLLDPRPPGEGASLGNAGIVACSEAIPFSTPATLAKVPAMLWDRRSPLWIRWSYLPAAMPWFLRFAMACRAQRVEATVQALRTLLSPSWESWFDLCRSGQARAFLRQVGWLRVFESGEAFAGQAAVVRRQRELGTEVRVLAGADIRDLEPSLAPIFTKGLFYPGNGLISHPLGVIRTLVEDYRAAGGRFLPEAVLRMEPGPDGATMLLATSTGQRSYDDVVLAAGAWSREILRTLGMDVPLDTERGYHIMLPQPERMLRRSVHFPESGFSLTPIADGIRLTSGVEFAGIAAAPDFRRIRSMVARAERLYPGLSDEPVSEWMGFRPSFPDSLPAIGRLARHPRVICAFGHGHLGLTTGPATGGLVADLAAGRAPRLDIRPFSPERWSLRHARR